ncbi:MAG TPA: transposase [Gemmataceae bacterium]|nr:transposase [Gemmataceae bacterium]
MPQSLAQIYLHVIFSTKEREPYLQDPVLRADMRDNLGATCRGLDCPSLAAGGVSDHVQILCRLSRTLSVANLARELKRKSSKWIKMTVRNSAAFVGHVFNVPAGVWARYKRAPQTAAADSHTAIKMKDRSCAQFHWQEGYGVFSLGASQVEKVRRYIATHEKHHSQRSFQDEFREFLNKYDLEYDERYVWDGQGRANPPSAVRRRAAGSGPSLYFGAATPSA